MGPSSGFGCRAPSSEERLAGLAGRHDRQPTRGLVLLDGTTVPEQRGK